jgi:hypothetical protein
MRGNKPYFNNIPQANSLLVSLKYTSSHVNVKYVRAAICFCCVVLYAPCNSFFSLSPTMYLLDYENSFPARSTYFAENM